MQMSPFRGRENDQFENISAFLIFLRGKWFKRRTQISSDMAGTVGHFPLSLSLPHPLSLYSPFLISLMSPSRPPHPTPFLSPPNLPLPPGCPVGVEGPGVKGQGAESRALLGLSLPEETNVVFEQLITGIIEFNTPFLD